MNANKRVLEFVADGQTLKKSQGCNFQGLVKGTKGYLVASFVFGNGYYGCGKMAVFTSNGEEYPVELVNDACEIPEEALLANTFSVSVIGVANGYRIKTNDVEVLQYE